MTTHPKLNALDPADYVVQITRPLTFSALTMGEHRDLVAAVIRHHTAALPAKDTGLVERLHILFDGPPSHESGRFVEVENDVGASINVGEWVERPDGLWDLVIPRALSLLDVGGEPRGEAVAWRYRHIGAGKSSPNAWLLINGEWPPHWGTEVWEREPLYTAPPAQPAREVAVKPLEWESVCEEPANDSVRSGPTIGWIANTVVGRYTISKRDGSDSPWWELTRATMFGVHTLGDEETDDEAKAAAQADYETHIRSVLRQPAVVQGATLLKAARSVLSAYDECSGAEPSLSVLFRTLDLELRPLVDAAQGATHRHKKRGTTYTLLGIGKIHTDGWAEHVDIRGKALGRWNSVNKREVAIYRSTDDGSLRVRPREEFEDGRFEVLTSTHPKGETL